MKTRAFLLSLFVFVASPIAAQETKKTTEQWIEHLGASDYEVRKAAETKLLELGEKALAPLRKIAKSHTDPEVKWRAGRLARRIAKGDAAERTLRKRDRSKREGEGEAIDPEVEVDVERSRRSVRGTDLDEIMRTVERALGGREFEGDARRDIDRAMEQLRKSLRGMGRWQFDRPKGGNFLQRSRGNSMKMSQGPDGVRVEIHDTGEDGKKRTKVYEADDMESFRKKHPGVLQDGNVRIRIGDVFGEDFPFGGRFDLRPRVLDLRGGQLRRRDRVADPLEVDPDEANSTGKKLGFYVGEISPVVREYLELEGGLMVDRVAADSIAEKLELRRGDILVEVGEKRIHAAEDVSEALEAIGDGEIRVGVIRRGRTLTLRTGAPVKGSKPAAKKTGAKSLRRR